MSEAANQSFGFLISDVTRLLRKHFDRRAVELGMTRAQWRALKAIDHRPGISQADLAEILEMEAIAVGRVIDRLQQAGFVERRPDPEDRRRWRLHPSSSRRDVLDHLDVIAQGLRKDALRGISDAEVRTVCRLLGKVKDNLQALDAEAP
jgi:MarR family transcriptional regulator, transcriptional regulator for hemolysin